MAKKTADPLWTIAELTERVSDVLAAGFCGVSNGRVRDIPDLRAIRYYTTIGLIDRPAEMRGRTAYYGRRHLCQLVAIKRLQSQGLSLAQVQEQLLNLENRELEKIAVIDKDVDRDKVEMGQEPSRRNNVRPSVETTPSDASTGTAVSAWAPPPPREEFWKASATTAPTPPVAQATERPEVVTLVPLLTGLSIGFEAKREITAEDIAALQAAAKPLLQLLIERQLVSPDLEREKHGEDTAHTESR